MFKIALEHWPVVGVPDRPEAWLLVTAGRAMSQQRRRLVRHEMVLPVLALAQADVEAAQAPGLAD